jgi:hypothetical protein
MALRIDERARWPLLSGTRPRLDVDRLLTSMKRRGLMRCVRWGAFAGYSFADEL